MKKMMIVMFLLIVSSSCLLSDMKRPRVSNDPGGGIYYSWGFEGRGSWLYMYEKNIDGENQIHYGCKGLFGDECYLHDWYVQVVVNFSDPNNVYQSWQELMNTLETNHNELLDVYYIYNESKESPYNNGLPEMPDEPIETQMSIELLLFND